MICPITKGECTACICDGHGDEWCEVGENFVKNLTECPDE